MNNTDSAISQSWSAATLPCDHCRGLVEHKPWCVTRAPKVQYAYAIVNDPCALSYRDSLILHSLGVSWRGPKRPY